MKKNSLRAVRFLLFLLALQFISFSSQAYLRPANQIIEVMLTAQQGASGFQMRQETEFIDPQFPNGRLSAKEMLYVRRPLALRLESDNSKFKQTVISRSGKVMVMTDGIITEDGNINHGLRTDLFSASETSEVLSRLQSAGIDTGVVSLGREKEKIYLVIGVKDGGAKEEQKKVPQLWVSKSDYMPFKLIVKEKSGAKESWIEVKFSGYGKGTAKWYPAYVDVFSDGTQIAAIKAKEFRNQDRLPDDLFDLEKNRASKTISKDVRRHGPFSSMQFAEMLDQLRK